MLLWIKQREKREYNLIGKSILKSNFHYKWKVNLIKWLHSPSSSSSSSLLKVITGFLDLRDFRGVTKLSSPRPETEGFAWPVKKTQKKKQKNVWPKKINQFFHKYICTLLLKVNSYEHRPLFDLVRPLVGRGVRMAVFSEDSPFWFSSSISGLSTFSSPRVWTAVSRFSNSSTWAWANQVTVSKLRWLRRVKLMQKLDVSNGCWE